ncbi:MAG TPA: SDR family oxidoreductase [Gemmatimonadales bacterium]|nr:SDR family oxidoreductase [Gemmatimonadales bacterium]
MRVTLKPIRRQVLVITGASSGIGLATARAAVRDGARVFLVARDEAALDQICADLNAITREPRAAYLAADVADADALERAAEEAVAHFGAIDTWVNNAGVSLYARLTEAHLDEKRRLFDVTFWGTVHGCRAALPRLRQRGGAIINVGGVTSDFALPLQGMYSAAKHAVKGYTDALRMELEADRVPVSVSLVKPSSANTPFFEHARTHLGVEPAPPPPVYQPEVVAETILECARRPIREVTVGAGAGVTALRWVAPRVADQLLERTMFQLQLSGPPARPDRRDNLFKPLSGGRVHGLYSGPVLDRSRYTEAALRPGRTALAAVGIGLAVMAGLTLLGGGD